MLFTRSNPQSQGSLLGRYAGSAYTEKDFKEDVREIVQLLRDGKLSNEDVEVVLSVLLSLYMTEQANTMAYELEDTFEQMSRDIVLNMDE